MIKDLIIEQENGFITAIRLAKEGEKQPENDIVAEAKKQIEEYFSGKRKTFDFPYKTSGTDFQKRVYEQTALIPFGQIKTYKQIAALAGNEKACRAVGQALNRNKLLLVVPCHRVVGSNNSLTGFALGIDIKRQLLEIEKSN